MTSLALFDFDGTLCKIDSFTGFYHFVFGKFNFLRKCIPILPSIIRHYSAQYPAYLMRPLLSAQLLKGQDMSKIDDIAKTYAKNLIQNHLNTEVLQLLKWHQAQGHQICLVSAGLDVYLNYIATVLNIDLICTETQIINSIFTGQYSSLDCSLEQKKQRIKEKYPLEFFEKIYAYGNSYEDFPMLTLASQCCWVDKDLRLHHFSGKQ